jgi:hypothetical protein
MRVIEPSVGVPAARGDDVPTAAPHVDASPVQMVAILDFDAGRHRKQQVHPAAASVHQQRIQPLVAVLGY